MVSFFQLRAFWIDLVDLDERSFYFYQMPIINQNFAYSFSILLLLFSFPGLIKAQAHMAGDIVTEKRSAKTPDGASVEYEIGSFYVPENRNNPNSRIIGVGFARLRGAKGSGKTPVFLLPGGPGESALTNFTKSDPASQRRLANFIKYYNSVGDLVVIDQRGFSDFGEKLMFSMPELRLDKPRSLADETAALKQAAREAVKANAGKDLAGYTLTQCAADVDDLRKALGYDKIILTGQSFGSQWSLAVIKLFPDTVERAQLSANEPLDNAYDMPSHIFASIQRITRDADADPALARYFPKGGMIEAIKAVNERLAAMPVTVTVKDGKTGRDIRIVLGVEDFRESLLTSAVELPALVASLYHKHYDEWARDRIGARKAFAEPSALIGPLIDTSLGVSPARERLLRTDPAAGILGLGAFETYIDSAADWPTPDLGDEFRSALPSKIPVMFVHGDWDTSTPLDNALALLPYFRNSHLTIVHRGSHGARKEALDYSAPLLEKVIEFLKTGELDGIPVEVTLPVPEFKKPGFAVPKISS